MTDEKNHIEHAVEVAVYAPIGFVLEAKRLLPSLVERGRQQVNMAKVVGQFAVTHGQTTANKKLAKVQEQAEAMLGELGLTSDRKATPTPAAAPAARPASVPAAPAAAPAPARTVRSSAAAAELPIADYDSLAASQVIPRLAGLSADELQAVQDYEVAHRGRKTILGKITQLGGA